ncbi:MAG: hypothetical protein NTV34_14110, partial [Proteobacteria bacterium]|nr:hypothetical protein [Pseudomonadota bacterium]
TKMAYDFGRNLLAEGVVRPVQFNLRTRYAPGGTAPRRILSMLAMHLILPVILCYWRILCLVTGRKLTQLATTLPPLIHINASIFGRTLSIPTVVWYQDAHPELEARICERKGLHFMAHMLRKLEFMWVGSTSQIVALDDAMATLIQQIKPNHPVKIAHPWITYVNPPKALRAPRADGTLKIFYAGNYGFAHDLEPLIKYIFELPQAVRDKIEITATGMNDLARAKFSRIFADVGVSIKTLPRMDSFAAVCDLMSQFDLGLVSLKMDCAGLASPSKAFTYISQGLPILYVGPPGTMPDQVSKQGWGINLDQLKAMTSQGGFSSTILRQNLSQNGNIYPDPSQRGYEVLRAAIE